MAWTDHRSILLQAALDKLMDHFDFEWALVVMGDRTTSKEIIIVNQPTKGKIVEAAIDRLYKKLYGADVATHPKQFQRHDGFIKLDTIQG